MDRTTKSREQERSAALEQARRHTEIRRAAMRAQQDARAAALQDQHGDRFVELDHMGRPVIWGRTNIPKVPARKE